jgi:CheY-like chemotaxis protein
MVVNLVTNAHQAMRQTPGPRRLTLSTRFDAARARAHLDVADTGPGIPPEIQARIFEPFFTTKPPGEGTGLGLSLCQGIIEAHGGSIRVASSPGQGATFRVELPITAPPETAPEEAAAKELPPVRGRTILVVDDEALVTELLADLLSADGQLVETASNGYVALEKLRTRAYDLILSDIRMPELDGPSLYREVERRHPELRQRFIFITGDLLTPETQKFLEESGLSSLSKPFALDEVRRLTQKILRML